MLSSRVALALPSIASASGAAAVARLAYPTQASLMSVPAWLSSTTNEEKLLQMKERYKQRLNKTRSHIRALRTKDSDRKKSRQLIKLWTDCLETVDRRIDALHGTEHYPRLQKPFQLNYQHRNSAVQHLIVSPKVVRVEDDAYAAFVRAEATLNAKRKAGQDVSAEEAAVAKSFAALEQITAELNARREAAEAEARAAATAAAAQIAAEEAAARKA